MFRLLRQIVRFWIAPLVRWSAEGNTFNLYSVRGRSGAFLCLIDCFGAVYERPLDMNMARQLADDILEDAYNAAENLPLPPKEYPYDG